MLQSLWISTVVGTGADGAREAAPDCADVGDASDEPLDGPPAELPGCEDPVVCAGAPPEAGGGEYSGI